MENDNDYRDRLIKCDGVGVCWAEDIGNATGADLDQIGERFNCPRKNN